MSDFAPKHTLPTARIGHDIDVPDLFAALGDLLRQVPAGRVTTYGALAQALGAIGAARWVASCLLDPEGSSDLPRHRVVLRDGSLGQLPGGDLRQKERLLASEGIAVSDRRVDVARYGFQDFATMRPLHELQLVQEQLLSRLRLRSPDAFPEFVAGVDVSYAGMGQGGPVEGFAGYALIEVSTCDLVWSLTVRDVVRFPYIPGFLAFRELPVLLKLLAEVRRRDRLADVMLVDGNGILHHRHAGIASHLGIVAGLPTIGIGKSLLCGTVDQSCIGPGPGRPVVFRGETVARALRNKARFRPVFVSPGNLVDLPFSVELTKRLFRKHRVPEPIYHAHAISRAAACEG